MQPELRELDEVLVEAYKDCSGHKLFWEWRETQEISDTALLGMLTTIVRSPFNHNMIAMGMAAQCIIATLCKKGLGIQYPEFLVLHESAWIRRNVVVALGECEMKEDIEFFLYDIDEAVREEARDALEDLEDE